MDLRLIYNPATWLNPSGGGGYWKGKLYLDLDSKDLDLYFIARMEDGEIMFTSDPIKVSDKLVTISVAFDFIEKKGVENLNIDVDLKAALRKKLKTRFKWP